MNLRDDPKYKDDEEAYDDDLEEMQEKTDALKPKDFPYTFYLMDAGQEKAFDDPIFATYRGPIYWNDCGRYDHIRITIISVTFTTRDFIVDPNQPKENFQPENMANLVYSSLTPLKVETEYKKRPNIIVLVKAHVSFNAKFDQSEGVFWRRETSDTKVSL